MPVQSKPFSRVEFLINAFSRWLEHRRQLSEMRQMDRTNFEQIASDLRLSTDTLEDLVQKGPHAADELPKLLQALGIDEAGLASSNPLMLRDMERVCSLCQRKGECDRDIIAGTSAEHYKAYCLNAPSIEEIQARTG
jgi:hypothetical protein